MKFARKRVGCKILACFLSLPVCSSLSFQKAAPHVRAVFSYAEAREIDDGSTEVVEDRRTVTGTVLRRGIQLVTSGGVARQTIVYAGSMQNIAREGTAQETRLAGGKQILGAGGKSLTASVEEGGEQIVRGGVARETTITWGTQLIEKGTAYDAVILDKGRQIIQGGKAYRTQLLGGIQDIEQGETWNTELSAGEQLIRGDGVARASRLYGGTQEVWGRSYQSILYSGGTMRIREGGEADMTQILGGSLQVLGRGTAGISGAESGTVSLAGGGEVATVSFGSERLGGTYQVTRLAASGGKVCLGIKESNARKILRIGTFEGNAHFIINTDLVHGAADKIAIEQAADGAAAKLQVNYDPGLRGNVLLAQEAKGVTVLTVGRGKLALGVVPTTLGGYIYTPTLKETVSENGTSYSLLSLNPVTGASPEEENSSSVTGNTRIIPGTRRPSALLAHTGSAAAHLLATVREDDTLLRERLAHICWQGGSPGVWLDFGRGRGRLRMGTDWCSTKHYGILGADGRAGDLLYGVAVAVHHSHESFDAGAGKTRGGSIALYAQKDLPQRRYLSVASGVGRLTADDEFFLVDEGKLVSLRFKTYTEQLSFAYGRAFSRRGMQIVPEISLGWSHANGGNFWLSEGTQTEISPMDALLLRMGVRMQRETDKGRIYGKLCFVRDFLGNADIVMRNLEIAKHRESLRGNWCNVMLGFAGQSGGVAWQLEMGAGRGEGYHEDFCVRGGVSLSFG